MLAVRCTPHLSVVRDGAEPAHDAQWPVATKVSERFEATDQFRVGVCFRAVTTIELRPAEVRTEVTHSCARADARSAWNQALFARGRGRTGSRFGSGLRPPSRASRSPARWSLP